jgi:hypothetical protein
MATAARRKRSREEAEIRKLEAETTEIKVRTALRLCAFLVFLATVAVILGGHLGGAADLLGRWLPML